MRIFPVLFEDHTLVNFRPLSWSQPVYELRCGIFNLRERLQQIWATAATTTGDSSQSRIGLLPRALLAPLHEGSVGAIGEQACASEMASAERTLFLNARLGVRWDVIAALLGESLKGERFVWSDAGGLLACCLEPQAALAVLAEWESWQQQNQDAGCWTDERKAATPFAAGGGSGLGPPVTLSDGSSYAGSGTAGPDACFLSSLLATDEFSTPPAFSYIWDLVYANGEAIEYDLQKSIAVDLPLSRRPFGIVPDPVSWPDGTPWSRAHDIRSIAERGSSAIPAGVSVLAPEKTWLAEDVDLDPGVVLDARHGPIVLDGQVSVQPHCYLEGPLYVGPGSLIKAGARVYGETSIGAVCKIAGEVAETIFSDFANKQHDGFIGHAVIGSWVNLGAGTTCSDLKNNYGPIKVDLGAGFIDTGRQFVGLLMGDHSKTAIGTLFNTGTCVGFSSNVFTPGLVRKRLPNYTWGDPAGPVFSSSKAVEVARIVMNRRGIILTDAHEALFAALTRRRD